MSRTDAARIATMFAPLHTRLAVARIMDTQGVSLEVAAAMARMERGPAGLPKEPSARTLLRRARAQ